MRAAAFHACRSRCIDAQPAFQRAPRVHGRCMHGRCMHGPHAFMRAPCVHGRCMLWVKGRVGSGSAAVPGGTYCSTTTRALHACSWCLAAGSRAGARRAGAGVAVRVAPFFIHAGSGAGRGGCAMQRLGRWQGESELAAESCKKTSTFVTFLIVTSMAGSPASLSWPTESM